jgi:hypothetical protein
VSMDQSDDDRVTADPVFLAAVRCPSIADRRRSASRSMVMGSEEATSGMLKSAGSEPSVPSSDTAWS